MRQSGSEAAHAPPPRKADPGDPSSNFSEYDDPEWDVGVGHLIIDLEADIAKMSSEDQKQQQHSLKMKIKRTKAPTKTSEAKHEIVKEVRPAAAAHKKDKRRPDLNGTVPSPPASPATANPLTPVTPKESRLSPGPVSSAPKPEGALPSPGTPTGGGATPLPKKLKVSEDPSLKKDCCVGTSIGTITEPDCLGPCEPGTSVTLEGIVWHETEGGVLVVNVTWRGKTYVGTLLDCTRHDWAPPRFCDSPTSDMESRTPKGRGKRARTATTATSTTPTSVELNIAETRSGKLRSTVTATVKGKRGGTTTPTFNPPPSPVKSESGGIKRKAKENESTPESKNAKKIRGISRGTPTNGTSSSPTTPEQPPVSPNLIECPEPNCNKKYKHINGLKYHQSHAHNNGALEEETASNEGRTESEVEESMPSSPAAIIEMPVDTSSKDSIKPSVLRFSGASQPQSPVPITTSTVSTTPVISTVSHTISVGMDNSPPLISQPPQVSQPSVIQARVPVTTAVFVCTPPQQTSVNAISPQRVTVAGTPSVGVPLVTAMPSAAVKAPVIRPEGPKLEAATHVTTPPALPRPLPAPIAPVTSGSTVLPSATVARHIPVSSPRLPSPVTTLAVSVSTVSMMKTKLAENDKQIKPKEQPLNGLITVSSLPKEEDMPSREDTHSPAYSDISDANDPPPTMGGDFDGKDLREDKKPDMPLGAPPPPYGPYGMYYSHYGQSPYIMSPALQPFPAHHAISKEMDHKDIKEKFIEKEKKVLSVPGGSEYKFPPPYLYSYSLYNNFPDPYLRDALYKENLEKLKLDSGKDSLGIGRENDKGPTDLSRTSIVNSTGGPSLSISKEKVKDKPENLSINKDIHHIAQDKRPFDSFRYISSPYEARVSLEASPSEKFCDKSRPSPPATHSSPRRELLQINKDEKIDKKPDLRNEGVKPTMETTGPPPPPTSSYYSAFPYSPIGFDPYRPIAPISLAAAGFPTSYLPGPPPHGFPPHRYSIGVPNGPEDLSRSAAGGGALFLPPHHMYTQHKIAELQERTPKSPVSFSSIPHSSVSTPAKVVSPLTVGGGISQCPPSTPGSSASGLERKSPISGPRCLPTHHSLHEGGFPYSVPTPFSPHYQALTAGQMAVVPTGVAPPGLTAPPAK